MAPGAPLVVEPDPSAGSRAGLKVRPRYELVMIVVRPLAAAVVVRLSRTRIEPWQVVVSHSIVGAVAALLLADGQAAGMLAAAVLLQVKTVLDNADGGLARATGRVTELGRYLDTGLDLVANVLLFAALAQHGPTWLTLLGLVILTVVLSYDFNAEALYREARSESTGGGAAPGSGTVGASSAAGPTPVAHAPERPSPALRLFKGLYDSLLAPQDRAIRRLDAALYRAATGESFEDAGPSRRRSWSNAASTGALVNLGLSTQYLVLGICAALGAPFTYVYIVLIQGVYLIAVQATRVASTRRRGLVAP